MKTALPLEEKGYIRVWFVLHAPEDEHKQATLYSAVLEIRK
jgi:hypothetical protein